MSDGNSTRIITPADSLVRFSYVHAFEPTAIEEGQTPKYSVSVIIGKDQKALLKKIDKAIDQAIELGKTKFGKAFENKKKLKLPLRDGDEEREDDEAYADSVFFNATSHKPPQVVGPNKNKIEDEEEFYSGCYGRISVNFYPYNKGGRPGIAAGLGNIQKVEDGDRLAGGPSAADDFGAAEDDDLL